MDWVDVFDDLIILLLIASGITGLYGLYLSGTTTSISSFFAGGSLMLSTYTVFLALCDCEALFYGFLSVYFTTLALLILLLDSLMVYRVGNKVDTIMSFSDLRGLSFQNGLYSLLLFFSYLFYIGFVPFSIFLNKFSFLILISSDFGLVITLYF
jgi:hypothetical protein